MDDAGAKLCIAVLSKDGAGLRAGLCKNVACEDCVKSRVAPCKVDSTRPEFLIVFRKVRSSCLLLPSLSNSAIKGSSGVPSWKLSTYREPEGGGEAVVRNKGEKYGDLTFSSSAVLCKTVLCADGALLAEPSVSNRRIVLLFRTPLGRPLPLRMGGGAFGSLILFFDPLGRPGPPHLRQSRTAGGS